MAHFSESANGLSKTKKRKRDDSKVDGYEDQAKLAARARRQFDSGQIYAGLPDRRFQKMDMSKLARHLKFYDEDPLVRIATEINLNASLGGSVVIADDSDDGGLDKKNNLDLRDWRSTTYTAFLESAYRYGTALGFIPWTYVPHGLDKGEPKIINLENGVDAFYCLNELSEPMYAFFQQPSTETMLGAGTYFGNSFVGRPMLNVFVTTWNSPGPNGEIRSLISTILSHSAFTSTYRKAAQRAVLKGANPLFVTEAIDKKIDPHELEGRYTMATGDKDDAVRRRVSQSMLELIEARNSLGPEEYESMYAELTARFGMVHGQIEGPRVDLETGRKVAKQVTPVSPGDLIGVTLLHQQLLLTVLGVPPSFILTESARGRIASGDDSNAATLFRNSQKKLKQRFVQLTSQAFNAIHDPDKILYYLMSQPFTRHVEDKEIARVRDRAEVTIPGTPPENYLEKLYKDGILSYEAYRRFIHVMHAIPETDLNETSALTLIDTITVGKESLLKLQMEHDTKLAKMQMDGKKKELELKMDGDEKKAKLDMKLSVQNADTMIATEKVKQKSMEQSMQMETLKQQGVAQKAKLGLTAKPKAKAKKKKA
jgi:hypothetical protein